VNSVKLSGWLQVSASLFQSREPSYTDGRLGDPEGQSMHRGEMMFDNARAHLPK
jgi:hypothetical protein